MKPIPFAIVEGDDLAGAELRVGMSSFLWRLLGWKQQSPETAQYGLERRGRVPEFNTYYPQIDNMSAEQLGFYRAFQKAWQSGHPIDVGGNISYIFCYAYEIIENGRIADAASELMRLASVYEAEDKIAEYLSGWASDCYVAQGDYAAALRVFPTISIDSRSTMGTDRLLTIKAFLGETIFGRDVLTLFGPKVTKYARDHLGQISEYIDIQLAEKQRHDGDILEAWVADAATPRHSFGLFSGVRFERRSKP